MNELPEKFGFSVSHTTRDPRLGEVAGVDYNFTGLDAMKASIARGSFIEYAEVHGNYYGTSVDAVSSVIDAGKSCFLDIDVQGAQQAKKSSLDGKTSYIFIRPPSEEVLERRLRDRGTETEHKIRLRLAAAKREMDFQASEQGFFDAVILNDDADEAYKSFSSHVRKVCNIE